MLELALLGTWCFLVALGGGMAGLVLGNIRLPGRAGAGRLAGGRCGGEHRHLRGGCYRGGGSPHPERADQLAAVRLDDPALDASVPGALLGARLTGRLSERRLMRAIGAVLVVAAVGTLVQAAT